MATANIFDLADTWNSGGTTYTAIKMDVTDTASAAGSKLLDLLVGGASKFSVDKAGAATTSGLTVSGGSVTLSGNISAAAWTTSGIRFKGVAATLTDTSSSGTVAAAYTNVYGGNTIAASNTTTFTDYFTTYINGPAAGTNVTLTNSYALGLGAPMKISAGTFTASRPILDLAQTWNASGTTFTGLKINVTDTASATASLLFDFQVGGSSLAFVRKDGAIGAASLSGNSAATGLNLSPNTSSGAHLRVSSAGVNLRDAGVYAWASSSTISASTDLTLARDAADTLALRRTTNAQTARIYLSYTDASNYTRLALKTAAGVQTIETESAGTGESNIDLALTPKGTGRVRFGTHAATTTETVTGYIEIKDSGGTTRKIAVVS